jgi:hypothetical protein
MLQKIWCQFPREPLPSRQSVHYLGSKLKTTGSLLDKKPGRKQTVLLEAKLDDIGARLETSPIAFLKQLPQETSVLKTSAGKATKLLKLQPYKTVIVHALKDILYKMNPDTLEEVRNHFCHEISTIPRDKLQRVNKNMFCSYTECFQSGG